jgi:hypothetical protein
MKTTKTLLAVLIAAVANFAHAGTLTPVQPMPADYNEQFSFDDLLNGPSSLSEEECNKKPFAVYVKLSWMSKACIRYFPSDNVGVAKDVTFFFNGDMMVTQRAGESKDFWEKQYGRWGNYKEQHRQANMYANITKGAFIIIGRPGTLGSTGGNHQPSRDTVDETENETLFINAAIDAIKAKFGYDRINIEGMSGGGRIVGGLLTEGRNDVDCAISESGAVSVATREIDYSGNSPRAGAYDPMRHIKDIKADPQRRFLQVTDPQDHQVSPRSQKEFVDAVAALGHNAYQVYADAPWDTQHHHGTTPVGARLMPLCRAGASTEVMQRAATKYVTNWVADQAKKAAKAAQPTETAAQ